MRRKRLLATVVVVSVIAVIGAILLTSTGSPELAGAELAADGEHEGYDWSGASLLVTGSSETFWVLFDRSPQAHPNAVAVQTVSDDAGVSQAADDGHTGVATIGVVTVGRDGHMVDAFDDTSEMNGIVVVPPGGSYIGGDGNGVGGGEISPGAATFGDDGLLLVGSYENGRIDEIEPGGTTRHLVGLRGDDAQAILEEPVNRIVSIVTLPDDDRVAFVADTPDGNQLFVVDGDVVERMQTDRSVLEPVELAFEPQNWPRRNSTPMEPLAPGRDGEVVTVGLGEEGDPEINLVDLDTGETRVIAELEGVEPSIDEPVSAALVGDDLFFLAEGKLWRLDDAA